METSAFVWFAMQGRSVAEFLDDFGFTDSGEPDEFLEAEASGAEYPGGWYVLVAADIELMDIEKLKQGSAGGRLIAVASDEDELSSFASEWRDGKSVWSISHEPTDGDPELAVDGDLPEVFETAHKEMLAQQDGVSTIELAFEIPVEVAARITGFRHDMIGWGDDAPAFSRLEPV